MKPLETLLADAARSERRIVLSEGTDPRVIEAALMARHARAARIVLVGPESEIAAALATQGPVPDGIEIADPENSPDLPRMARTYHELRRHKGVDEVAALAAARRPHVFAALMVRLGLADGTLGGAQLTTAEIVRTAIQVIGKAPEAKLVSSFFLMLFCARHHAQGRACLLRCGPRGGPDGRGDGRDRPCLGCFPRSAGRRDAARGDAVLLDPRLGRA